MLSGGDGADTIYGGAGADTISGGDDADMIYGDAGADTITGGAGSDTITGGADSDVAIFAGNQADYTFASASDGLTITITDTANNYVDTVTGVETLKFNDGEIAVSREGTQLVLTGDDTIGDNIEIVGQYPVTVRGRSFDDDIVGGDQRLRD